MSGNTYYTKCQLAETPGDAAQGNSQPTPCGSIIINQCVNVCAFSKLKLYYGRESIDSSKNTHAQYTPPYTLNAPLVLPVQADTLIACRRRNSSIRFVNSGGFGSCITNGVVVYLVGLIWPTGNAVCSVAQSNS